MRLSSGIWSPPVKGPPRLSGIFSHFLGQQGMPVITVKSGSVEDIPQVVSGEDWANQQWVKDQAMAIFKIANLLWNIHEKIAFSSIFFSSLVSDPRTLAAINKTGHAGPFLDATNSLVKLTEQFSLQNLMSSVRNLSSTLEINVLQKFGVGIKGTRAVFRNQSGLPKRLDDVTSSVGLSNNEILDFGNIYSSSLNDDVKALQEALKGVSGSQVSSVATYIVNFSGWVVQALLIGGVQNIPTVSTMSDGINPVLSSSELSAVIGGLKKTDPNKAQEMSNNLLSSQNVWKQPASVFKLVGISLAVVGVAWIGWTLLAPSPTTEAAAPQ